MSEPKIDVYINLSDPTKNRVVDTAQRSIPVKQVELRTGEVSHNEVVLRIPIKAVNLRVKGRNHDSAWEQWVQP